MWFDIYDYNKWLILLSVIQLSVGHCILLCDLYKLKANWAFFEIFKILFQKNLTECSILITKKLLCNFTFNSIVTSTIHFDTIYFCCRKSMFCFFFKLPKFIHPFCLDFKMISEKLCLFLFLFTILSLFWNCYSKLGKPLFLLKQWNSCGNII